MSNKKLARHSICLIVDEEVASDSITICPQACTNKNLVYKLNWENEEESWEITGCVNEIFVMCKSHGALSCHFGILVFL